MRSITKIIVHCSATPEGRHHTSADIARWHKERMFNTIGYHYVILLDGTIEVGRPEHLPGAHAVGHNADSIGVCYIGGCDAQMQPKDTRTTEQRHALNFLLHSLKHKYNATIYGHRDFSSKACPGYDAKHEYRNL